MYRSEGVKKSLAKVTREEMQKHTGQVMAVGMNGEGVIASAPNREELCAKVANEFGKDYRFLVIPGAVRKANPTTLR